MYVVMISVCILFIVIPHTVSQYAISYGMRPDVTFNEDNDRFDVTNIVIDQNEQFPEPKKFRRYFNHDRIIKRNNIFRRKDAPSDVSSIENGSYEPYTNSDYKSPTINNNKKRFAPLLNFEKTKSGVTGDFAYHDKMDSGEYDTDYEKNLRPFQISRRSHNRLIQNIREGKVGDRRSMATANPEEEILFNHAVPIKMTINGFLVPE